jgi:thiamine-phosphate pyrophosphorylase
MKSIREALLYGILDLGYVSPEHLEHVTEQLLLGGVDVLQLRAKGFDEEAIEAMARRVVSLTEQAGVPLILNDHPELVPSVGAQGAHVGQDDFSVPDARWRAGRALAGEVPLPWIGKSTHSPAQASLAAEQGADYIGFGPLFPTPTKPGRPAIGLEEIAKVHQELSLPIFCIGGIHLGNLSQVLDAGARRVVVVSGILKAADIPTYCRELKSALLALQPE